MTSGKFQIIPVNSISVVREERQRKELKGIEELAESIRQNGLINPITITKDYVLVAGERRLTAHKHLGFDQIAVQFVEDLDETARHLIELEENVRRDDLDWKDHVEAIARYHELRKSEADSWSQEDTAEALGMSPTNVRKHLLVKKYIDNGYELVANANQFSTAYNVANRAAERSKTKALRDLDIATETPIQSPEESDAEIEEFFASPPAEKKVSVEILNTNFIKWADSVQERPFNFLHVDFPYGVSAGNTAGQTGAKTFGGYEDTPEVYYELLNALLSKADNFISPAAHMMFWFSMDYYVETKEMLSAGGWKVNPFPLVWHKSDNSGVLPDKDRGPRRTYETAFLCSRGDRKVVRPVANSLGSSIVPSAQRIHMSQKPQAVLEHFFRMLVDESTVMLDPTCGSGAAVKVADMMGAKYSLGIELNEEYATAAKENVGLL